MINHQHLSSAEHCLSTGSTDHTALARFLCKLFAFALYAVLVLLGGLTNPESYTTRLLTLPYLVGGLALVRSIAEALDHHHDLHAALFGLGLSTLGALA